jgi:hypothetical protein
MMDELMVNEDELLGDIKMSCSIQELIDLVSFGRNKLEPQHLPIIFQRLSNFKESRYRNKIKIYTYFKDFDINFVFIILVTMWKPYISMEALSYSVKG